MAHVGQKVSIKPSYSMDTKDWTVMDSVALCEGEVLELSPFGDGDDRVWVNGQGECIVPRCRLVPLYS